MDRNVSGYASMSNTVTTPLFHILPVVISTCDLGHLRLTGSSGVHDARESRNDSAILTDITFYDLKLRDHLDDRKLCLESSFVEMQSWPFQCSQQIEWFIC